jgi:glucokinase
MFSRELIAPIKSWEVDGVARICTAIDIGGSGLRIQLSNARKPDQIVELGHVRAQSTNEAFEILTNLENAIEEVSAGYQCQGASLAVAGPISKGRVVLTNWPGDVCERTIIVDELPGRILPHHHTVLLNDLEAGAYGVIAADHLGILEDHFEQLWPEVAPKGSIVSDRRTAVLAMGSGLGAALIVKTAFLGRPLVLPTEFGHVQIPLACDQDPNYAQERDLVQFVSDHYYQGKEAPEYEDIGSGRGLCLAYQYFYWKANGEKVPLESIDAGNVAAKASDGDAVALSALTWHYKVFLRAAKAIATSLVCDSVVLALDNQVKNSWFVTAISDRLREEFYNFIRPDWMTGIRVYSQIRVCNFNILGTAYIAHQIASE